MSPLLRRPLISACLSLAIASGSVSAAAGEVDDKPFADHPINEWVKQSPRDGLPAPGFGWEGSGSWDPGARQWIHFGGHDGHPQGFLLFTADVTSGRWRQRFPNTSPPGVCCVDGSNIFDPANGRFIAGWPRRRSGVGVARATRGRTLDSPPRLRAASFVGKIEGRSSPSTHGARPMRRIDDFEGHAQFVTFSCYRRRRLLDDDRCKRIVIEQAPTRS